VTSQWQLLNFWCLWLFVGRTCQVWLFVDDRSHTTRILLILSYYSMSPPPPFCTAISYFSFFGLYCSQNDFDLFANLLSYLWKCGSLLPTPASTGCLIFYCIVIAIVCVYFPRVTSRFLTCSSDFDFLVIFVGLWRFCTDVPWLWHRINRSEKMTMMVVCGCRTTVIHVLLRRRRRQQQQRRQCLGRRQRLSISTRL